MPRNVKESDDECETKGGRRTRTMLNPSVLDSPLRRSSRIRQPATQNDLSPEYASDVSSASGTKTTRRRTTALDTINPETQRNLRTRRNSATSDISELAENDSAMESVGKRITRRSIAAVPSVEAPAKLPPKTRRATRAGSETKSTPPVGRVTRRTRASSMEPEVTDDLRSQRADTPAKSRKRASVMPSEPAVAEESEDSRMDKTVFDIDEDESEISPDVSQSSRRKSKGETTEDEKMDVDESPVMESEVDTTDKSYDEKTEGSRDISDSGVSTVTENEKEPMAMSDTEASGDKTPKRQSISNIPKGSPYTIENLLSKSPEPGDESPSNKENKISNAGSLSAAKTTQPLENRDLSRKSLNSAFGKITGRRCSVTLDNELVSVYQESKVIAKAQEIVAVNTISSNEISSQKDYSVDAKCVVVIEPIDVGQMTTIKIDPSPNVETPDTPNDPEKQENSVSTVQNTLEAGENDNNEICVMKIIDVVDLEEETFDGEKDDKVKDNHAEKPTENEHFSEVSSAIPPSEDSMVPESSSEAGASIKPAEPEGNDGAIICDEMTSAGTCARDESLDTKVCQDSEENVEISCEIVTTTTISEGGDAEEIASKPEEEIASKPEDALESCKIASASASSINDKVSRDTEMPKECEDNDENDKIIDESLKDRNPSIVTESPARGSNAEESLKGPDATEKRRSVDKSSCEQAESTKNVEEINEMRVFESDDESESIVCPSFKDIPADEWAERENIEDKATANADKDSLDSYSTERNESECEIALVDKEPWQPLDRIPRKSLEKNSNSDSDDTVIAKFDKESNFFVEIGGKRVDGKKLSEDELLAEETPMDVSSDALDDNEPEKSNGFEKSPKKRASLDNSMKNRKSLTKSPLNDSKRKSLDANDSVDPDASLSRKSLNKSLKKRSLNASQQNENLSDEDSHSEINQSKKSPKSEQISRKSLTGSAKKSNSSLLDTSNSENRKSLNKSRLDSQETAELETEEIDKKSRRSENQRNSLNKSKIDRASSEFVGEEENDSLEKLNVSSKSESSRKSLNSRRNSKNAEEIAESSENLNKSRKSDAVPETLDNGQESEVELESSGSEIEKYENLLLELNESTKSTNGRKSLNNKNLSKIQEPSSESEMEEEKSEFNRSTKSTSGRKSLNNKNTSKIQEQSSESEMEEEKSEFNRSTKSTNGRKSLNNKNTSKIQKQSSESEMEEEKSKLNRSSKSIGDRKSLNNKNTSKIQEQSSESEMEEEKSKLNRSSKSMGDRKSLNNKNTSKIQEQSSESEMEEEKSNLNRLSKSIGDRKSLNNKNTSKIQEQSSESEMEEEKSKLNRSSKSMSDRKSLNNKNTSKIQEQSSESEMEEEKSNLNRSSKSIGDRKSLNNKNTSKIQEQSSESEMEKEKSNLNRSSKSIGDRKSLNNKNTSKIQEQSSESEMEEEKSKLNRSSKSMGDRKSLNNKNTSKIQEQSSESEMEEEKSELNRSTKSTSGRKSLNARNASKIAEESSDSESEEKNTSKSSNSNRRSSIEKNRSIKVPEAGEKDSEAESSDNEDNSSQKLPLFFNDANTDSEAEDSAESIDADIVDEMNLHGKSELAYSDDDVPGDDCMLTESESHDSENDDGEDLKDFVVDDDEYESEDGELELGDDEREPSNSARKVKNKKRKRIIPKAKSDSDTSGSESEKETSKTSRNSLSKDSSMKQNKTPPPKNLNESLKAKNTKSPVSSSTLESDENPQNPQVTSSSPEKSSRTPKNANKKNELIQMIEETPSELPEAVQASTKKMHKLLSHSSTPKLSPQKKSLEKLNSPKSPKLDNSKLETSRKSFKPNTTIETPVRLSVSFKDTKTPKTKKSQLHTSLPMDLNVSGDKTVLSNIKSPTLSALHQTLTTIVADNSESRFLMKEKLNESLPALKLLLKAKESRRSVSDKLREVENLEEVDEPVDGIVEPEVGDAEKKKKKKKKKKNKQVVDEVAEESPEAASKQSLVSNESQESVEPDVASKKSKKRKKNKKQVEIEQPEEAEESVQEVVEVKKKKQKLNVSEEAVEESEKKKKKKKNKQVTIVEPEVAIESSSKATKKSKAERTMDAESSKTIASETGENSGQLPSRIKRLPEDVLESLSQSVERPRKRRKIVKEEQIVPSKRMFSPGGKTARNIEVDDDYISLSSFGGTTQFESVDLSKLTKKSSKKSTAVQSFRERMLSRNPRQPISAYLMYQQKQKASGKANRH